MGRGIALHFYDRGTRKWWVVSSTLRPHFIPGEDPVPIVQEAGWALGPDWTGEKSRPHRDSIPRREGPSSITSQWNFGGGNDIGRWFSPTTSVYPCHYDFATVLVDSSIVSMIVQGLLSICSLSVWLCQCFCRLVVCQYDCASASANLSPISMFMPVFLSICLQLVWLPVFLPSCPLSIWLFQCFYRFVPSQYDCATTPCSPLPHLPLTPTSLHNAHSSFRGTRFEWRPEHSIICLGPLLYLQWLTLSWCILFTCLLIFAKEGH